MAKKSEKDKMKSGEPYKAFGKTLLNERIHTREILFRFNNLKPKKIKKRNKLIKLLFKSTGSNFHIEPPLRCDYGYNISIGENFYSNFNFVILDCGKVQIGDNVLIGPNVSIFAAGHPIDVRLRIEGYEFGSDIKIGSNVWIGGQVVINPGVSIGDNSIIGSGSVVTKNIPENVIAVGNPCKVLRQLD